MGTVIEFHPADAGIPPRSNLSALTPLVSVFACEREILPLVRYLFEEHGIFSVADWDAVPVSVLDSCEFSREIKSRFRVKLGRPHRPSNSGQLSHLNAYRPK